MLSVLNCIISLLWARLCVCLCVWGVDVHGAHECSIGRFIVINQPSKHKTKTDHEPADRIQSINDYVLI